MSNPDSQEERNDPRSELIVRKIMLDGCLPVLSSHGASGRGENYGPFLQRRVEPPVIETRYALRRRVFDGDGDGEAEEGEEGKEAEARQAMIDCLRTVESIVEHLQEDQSTTGTGLSSIPKWGDPAIRFREYTSKAHTTQLDLFSDIMRRVYTEPQQTPSYRDSFAYRVHRDVEGFLKDLGDGGIQVQGPSSGEGERELDWFEYGDRLSRAVASVDGVDALCRESPGTVKIAFTTRVSQPTRLARITSPAREDGGNTVGAMEWRILRPEVGISLHVMDDCPSWLQNDSGAQESYRQSITAATDAAVNKETALTEMMESEELVSQHFVVDTRLFEHHIFSAAVYKVADQVSVMKKGMHTGEAMMSQEGDGEGVGIDGHLVKIEWVDASTLDVLSGRQCSGGGGPAYWKKLADYRHSIERGLEAMRGERTGGGSSGHDASGETTWGTWTQSL